jgi:hypothetical protein
VNVINQPNSPFVVKQANSTNQTISNLKTSVVIHIQINTGRKIRGRGRPYNSRRRPLEKRSGSKNLKT